MASSNIKHSFPFVSFHKMIEDPGPAIVTKIVQSRSKQKYVSIINLFNESYFSNSFPAVTSWENVAFLALIGSKGSSTESMMNILCSSPVSELRLMFLSRTLA